MLADIAEECGKVGLGLHPEKTKILHNGLGYGREVKTAKVADMTIEVVGTQVRTMYLGRSLSLTDTHEAELQHRLQKAWAKFGVYKEELTNKDIPLNLRLRLLQTVITPTVLYGCSAWALTEAQKQKLQTTQMRMLRRIIGRRRKVEEETGDIETWVSWIKRTTEIAKTKMKEHKIQEWRDTADSRKEKWKARLETLDPGKWAYQAYNWYPIGFRSVGQPRKRW